MTVETTIETTEGTPLLKVTDLSVFLPKPDGGEVQVVDQVSFTVDHRQMVGMIGESGSGKSMTALGLLGLLPPGARTEGRVRLDGRDITALGRRERSRLRGAEIAMIFQEPMTALDPVFTIGKQISEVLRTHKRRSKRAARREVIEILDAVGIPAPARRFNEYPHQLSGGMRQRAMIAMALVCEARLLVADEPTTAVDTTIQAQILDLLRRLSIERGMSLLFITHDIGVVAELCSKLVVMYAGQVVENGTTEQVLLAPAHPYTSGLIWAIPRIELRNERLQGIPGRLPAPDRLPTGCRFSTRCAFVEPVCRETQPVLRPAIDRQMVRCHRFGEIDLAGVLSPAPHDPAEATTLPEAASPVVVAPQPLTGSMGEQP